MPRDTCWPCWEHDRTGARALKRACDESTLRGVRGSVDGDALDCAIGAWPARTVGVRAIAVDGKTPRGTCDETGQGGVHLLAAMTHHSAIVVAQREVGTKTNEITRLQPLLSTVDTARGRAHR